MRQSIRRDGLISCNISCVKEMCKCIVLSIHLGFNIHMSPVEPQHISVSVCRLMDLANTLPAGDIHYTATENINNNLLKV